MKHQTLKILISIIVLVGFSSSRSSVIKFQSLGIDDGVYKSVRSISQDQQGVIWLGTEQGLTQFDGVNLKTYQVDGKNGLSGNYFTGIVSSDPKGLWVATTSNGLNFRKSLGGSFISYKTSNSNIVSNNINTIKTGNNNSIWVGTRHGISRLNTIDKSFQNYDSNFFEANGAASSDVKSIILPFKDTVWFGTQSGLYEFSEDSSSIVEIKLPSKNPLTVRALAKDQEGNIWIGSSQGLFYFNLSSKTITQKFPKFKNTYILSLLVDSDNNLWVGTRENGLHYLGQGGETYSYRHDKGDDKSLGDVAILSLFQDSSGVIWVGTYDSGIHWFDPNLLSINAYDNSLSSIHCLPSGKVFAAQPVDTNLVYLGTEFGLSLVDISNNTCQNYKYSTNDNINSISGETVYALHRDLEGYLWVGTSQGIDKLVSENHFLKLGELIDNSKVYFIIENNQGRLVLGTLNGVYVSNSSKTNFQKLQVSKQLDNFYLYEWKFSSDGKLWMGTDRGILALDSQLENLEQFYVDPESGFITAVRSILPVNERSILVSIDGRGVFDFNPLTKSLTSVSDKFNIPVRYAFSGFFKDNDDGIWLTTTNNGAYKFHIDQNGSNHYSYDDGLISNYIMPGSVTALSNNRLLFGARDGFSVLNPSKIKKNETPPKMTINQLYLHGNLVGSTNDSEFHLSSPIHLSNFLEFAHFDNTIGFEFKAIHFSQPKENKISYMLEGISDNWVTVNAANSFVNFEDIPAGIYKLRYKAASANDIWSNEKSLTIKINTAPWATWWAYTLYVISGILLVFFIIKKRTELLTRRAEILEQTVDERTNELQLEKSKVEQLLSKKNEEFANVSHEFRTPLTLILGPVRQLLAKGNSETDNQRLNVIQRNGYRLLRMVDQLLNLETFRIKAITQQTPQATGKIIRLVADAFADVASLKNITLNVGQIDNVNFEFTPDALEKIVLNLLSNAIKYTPENGEIFISSVRSKNNVLTVQVKDSGRGIPKDRLDSVFERYNRVLDENSENVTGAGIGLALVKDLVTAHHGTINLESQLNIGTNITVALPILNEVSDQNIDAYQNDEIVAMELMSLTQQSTFNPQINESFIADENSSKRLILVVEDNRDMRNYIVESISNEYRVIVAENGREGVNLAKEHIPDLVISDIMMPQMDGFEATNEMRTCEITSHIPIILLTARGDRESRLKGWYEKADEYLTKPFDDEELLIRITNLLEIRDILRERFRHKVFESTQTSNLELTSIEKIANSDARELKFVKKLEEVLEKNFHRSEFKVTELANELATSERQLTRKTKGILNITSAEYIKRYRLKKASVLLKQGVVPSNIWIDVGFSSHSHFGRCFKAQYGCTPTEFTQDETL